MVRITFLHPDLGIGGAERLVVDAALALKKKGHDVNFVTTHHDADHCFDETVDGTLPVTVVGDWLPRHVFGKFFALCAYIRMVYAALYIIFQPNRPDLVFCDLVSVCIPVLKLRIPLVVFYCHYPDQLLTKNDNFWKSLYRIPLNYLEEITTGCAHKIFVNSAFTQQVFQATFKRLHSKSTEILYPSINTDFFDNTQILTLEKILDQKLPSDSCVILSINRYERKKNLCLAIKALAESKQFLQPVEYDNLYLIVAGGYDKRLQENVEYHLELISLADELGVTEKVFFLKSPSDAFKVSLLANCDILIYTPANEHFGIVPLEAMYSSKPVIAHNSGGPKETVVNDVTGFLAETRDFPNKLATLVTSKVIRNKFGIAAKESFTKRFSFAAFTDKLSESINDVISNEKKVK